MRNHLHYAAIATLGAVIAVSALASAPANAQTVKTDNAGNYSGSYDGSNKGSGFTVFSVSTVTTGGGFAGTFIGDASVSEGNNGTPTPGSIDTSSQAFGFYANGSSSAAVSINRGFATSLHNVGDSFSMDFVTGYNDSGTVGVALTNTGGNVAAFQYTAGGTGFTFAGNSTGQGYFSGAIHLTWTLSSASTVSFTATNSGSGFNYSNTAALSSPATGFDVYQTNSGSGSSDHNGYFNNLAVTNQTAAPEPAAVALALPSLAGMTFAAARRRRRRA